MVAFVYRFVKQRNEECLEGLVLKHQSSLQSCWLINKSTIWRLIGKCEWFNKEDFRLQLWYSYNKLMMNDGHWILVNWPLCSPWLSVVAPSAQMAIAGSSTTATSATSLTMVSTTTAAAASSQLQLQLVRGQDAKAAALKGWVWNSCTLYILPSGSRMFTCGGGNTFCCALMWPFAVDQV